MISALIPAVAGLIGKAIDRAVPDKAEAERLKTAVNQQVLRLAEAELKGAVSIILAEANGQSWLQRNWRPLLMLWFAALVGAHWLGFTAPNLEEAVILKLLGIVQVGVGGYVVGRSAEKIASRWPKK